MRYFKEYLELLQQIKDTPNEKWLIFCLDRQQGQDLAQGVNNYLNSSCAAVAINAQSAKRSQGSASRMAYEEIKLNSKFSCRVLVSTSVLDNGVNLHDD